MRRCGDGGWNEHGNLATGSLDDVKAPVGIWPPLRKPKRKRLGCGLCIFGGKHQRMSDVATFHASVKHDKIGAYTQAGS